MASKIYLGITFCFLWITKGSVNGQVPKLQFVADGQLPYDVDRLDQTDMLVEPRLLGFLTANNQIMACGYGIWRFYPETGYNFLTPAITGFQIGYDAEYRCFNIGGDGFKIAQMKSYRLLGPYDGNGDVNLDQQSLTIYEGEFATLRQKTFYPTDIVDDIPRNPFVAKSFLITGDNIFPSQSDDDRVPVFKIFWNLQADTNTDPRTICYLLSNDGSEDYPKTHFQKTMQFVDDTDGRSKSMYMGALRHYTKTNFDNNGITCSFPIQDVGKQQNFNLKTFEEINYPKKEA